MSRLASFPQEPEKFDKYKNLRSHAREAATYLTGIPYQEKEAPKFRGYQKPGRGVSGESGN